MSKVITFRVNEEELKEMNSGMRRAQEYYAKTNPLSPELGTSEIIKFIIKSYVAPRKGIKIPYKKWTKDEIAEFLGISQFDKRWVSFMDNIEKIYYE